MKTIPSTEIDALKKFVRAADYLAATQIYLRDNVLLKRKLKSVDIKPRLLGHWGTCPGINFVYAHVNRLIVKNNTDILIVIGPGHGFPAMQANLFLEGSLSKFYPKTIPFNEKGIKEICERFSAPYGYPSHSNPSAPGAILEGGELGYSLSVAFGSVLDNPDLITCCLVGDGEAETGPIAASWHVNKILSPKENGAVLPILDVNGYKISGPTIFGRMSDVELAKLFEGYGYEPFFVTEEKTVDIYEQMAKIMDTCYSRIRNIQHQVRELGEDVEKPRWPMIVLRTPKGWNSIAEYGGVKIEGNCQSHQVIVKDCKNDPMQLRALERWFRSYKFEELFKKGMFGRMHFCDEIKSLIPKKGMASGSQKYAFGGEVVQKLKYPDLKKLAKKGFKPGREKSSAMKYCGTFLESVFKLNKKYNNIRVFSPDETYSNKIDAVFNETKRSWQWPNEAWDEDMAREGKVMEMLSEHTLFGLMHGYNVTGRHGVFVSYEAFVQVIASMADQYVKFVKASHEAPFRKPLPAMNIILTSLLERQDHNGFSHQNPSFISSMMEKDGNIIHSYFPPDANCMLVTMKECFQSRNRLNCIVAGKKPQYNWLTLSQAEKQMDSGIMTWDFASDHDPQVILVGTGDYVTNECLAAIQIMKSLLSKIRIRFVNISELTTLGVGDETVGADSEFLDKFFTHDKGVVYNFHGYPHTVKKLLFDYSGAQRVKVNGYLEEGSTTTPFDMETRNKTSRYHLVLDMVEKLYAQEDIDKVAHNEVNKEIEKRLKDHKAYIVKHGVDPKEIEEWRF